MTNIQNILITDNEQLTCLPLTLSELISIYDGRYDIFKQACEINNKGVSDVTLPALKPNIVYNLTYDTMERRPMDYRDYADWDLPCLLTVAIPSVRLWPVSTSPKRLLLVTKFIIAKFRMNSMVKRLQGKANKCTGGGSVTARGESAGCRSMGLLYVASV
jgi:hypothetical protein